MQCSAPDVRPTPHEVRAGENDNDEELARVIHDASIFAGYGLPAMTRLSILTLKECGIRWNFVALCGTMQMGGDLISSSWL